MLGWLALSVTSISMAVAGPTWEPRPSGTKAQFRGISVVDAKIAWLAGSMGTFGRCIDGDTWTCQQIPDSQIPGASKLMFRSVAGFDADHAVMLAIGQGDQSKIVETKDGGKTWSVRWTNPDPKAFFDAVAFWDSQHGVAFSDPVEGQFPLISTEDGGHTWNPMTGVHMPIALKGEGAFSASGTCINVYGENDVWIATGGAAVSRVFHSADRGQNWTVAEVPIAAGKETAGIFGLAFFKDGPTGIAVGGDYKDPEHGQNQMALTSDGGKTWRPTAAFPTGLREGFDIRKKHWFAVGPSGSDYSMDGGQTWTPMGTKNLHCIEIMAGKGWAAGDNGLIVKLVWPKG